MSRHDAGGEHYPRHERGARDAWRIAGMPDFSVPDAIVIGWLIETCKAISGRPATWAATAYLVNARDELIRELVERRGHRPRRVARVARLPLPLVRSVLDRQTWRDLL